MKMREDENIVKYVKRIKASVSAIRSSGKKNRGQNSCKQGTQNSPSYLCN